MIFNFLYIFLHFLLYLVTFLNFAFRQILIYHFLALYNLLLFALNKFQLFLFN